MAPLLTGAMKRMSDGDTSAFVKLLKATPAELRQETTASGLASFFRQTARGGEMDFAGFAKWFAGLERNKQAYTALMANLPPQAAQQLKDMARVAKGIAMSKGEFLATGKALNTKALEQAETLTGRVYEAVKKRGLMGLVTEAVGSVGGLPGFATMLQSSVAGSKTTGVQAADKLLTSPAFTELVMAQTPQATKAAARKMAYSKEFVKFMRTLNNPAEMGNREQWILRAMEAENSQRPPKGKPNAGR